MEMPRSLPNNNENSATHHHNGQEIIEIREQYGNQENNAEIVSQDLGISSGYNKRRKLTSKVWDEFRKYKDENGKEWAICNHCRKKFDGSSKKGTTHLKNHSQRCPKRKNGDEDADKSMKTTIDVTSPDGFKEKSVVDLVANAMFCDDWDRMEELLSELNSRKSEIFQVHNKEKAKLSKFLNNLSCRFTLRIETIDGWHVLTVHYIDDSWEHRWKIIDCVKATESDHANVVEAIKKSCLDLKIDGNICFANYDFKYKKLDFVSWDDVIGETNSWLNKRPSLPAGCSLICTGDLSENLRYYADSFTCSGLHRCIDYVNKTASNRHKFEIAVDKVNSVGKKVLTSQFLPRYISSLYYFWVAVSYKEAFCELEHIDPDFKSINLTQEEWDDATLTYKHLDELMRSVDSLWCGNDYTTLHFPQFCDVYMKLLPRQRIEGYRLGESTLHILASIRKTFFDPYWKVMVITVVLDPRFKMEIVQLWYNKIYGDDADSYLQKIKDDFIDVYNEYASRGSTSSISYLDAMGRPRTSSKGVSSKSELDRYLNDDPKCPRYENLDILAWWRANTEIYPTLARMARDFLPVPMNFSFPYLSKHLIWDWTGGSLDDDIKAACLCLANWLELVEVV